MSLDTNTGGGFRYLSIRRLKLFLSQKLQAVLILDEPCVAFLPVPIFCVDASPTWVYSLRNCHLFLSVIFPLYWNTIKKDRSIFSLVLPFWIMMFYNSVTLHYANKCSRSITWHIPQGQYVIRSSCADFHASCMYIQLWCKIGCYGFSSCHLEYKEICSPEKIQEDLSSRSGHFIYTWL